MHIYGKIFYLIEKKRMNKEEVTEIVGRIINDCKEKKVDSKTMYMIVIQVMEYVELRRELSGIEKKKIALSIIEEVAKQVSSSFLQDSDLISTSIDMIIDASRGKFSFNKFKGVVRTLKRLIPLKCLKPSKSK
jgi:hypothetical protein